MNIKNKSFQILIAVENASLTHFTSFVLFQILCCEKQSRVVLDSTSCLHTIGIKIRLQRDFLVTHDCDWKIRINYIYWSTVSVNQ